MRQINQILTERAMPNDLVFVRHGESESNLVQHLERQGIRHPQYEKIASQADWRQRLTKTGIEQSKLAGKWLDEEMGGVDSFDACYVSPFVRARETASYLGSCDWIVDDRIVERFRGVYGVEAYNQEQINKLVEHRDTSPWYARPDWGESLQDVFQRYRIFQNSIKRHHAGEKVLVVSHSDFIKTARYAIEWMMPEQWQKSFFDQSQVIANCEIIHYSRVNPYNPSEISPGIKWMRVINLIEPEKSLKWIELDIKRVYSSDDLRRSVDKFDRFI